MHLSWHAPMAGFTQAASSPPSIINDEPLMKPIDSTGSFWLADNPEIKLWGTVKFMPGLGIKLVLEGSLFGTNPPPPRKVGTIFGRLFNGALCTLFEPYCRVEEYYSDIRSFRTECSSHLMLARGHYLKLSECNIARAQIKLTHLDLWFDSPYTLSPTENIAGTYVLKFNPSQLDVDVSFSGVSVNIKSFCQRSLGSIKPNGENLRWGYTLELTASSEQSAAWYLELAAAVRQMFVFLIGSGVYNLEFVGHQSPGEVVELYYPATVPRVIRYDKDCFSTRYSEFHSVIPNLIKNWFSRRENMQVAFDTYSELLCADGTSATTVLLRTVQTLEHLYGIIWSENSKYVQKPTFKRFVGWIRANFPTKIEHVSPDEMKALTEKSEIILARLGNLNDLSLRSKLTKFISDIPPGISHQIFGDALADGQDEVFLERLEATRHYYTHFSEEQKEKAFRVEQIEGAALTAWALLSYWMAQALELPPQTSANIAYQAKSAMFLVNRNTS